MKGQICNCDFLFANAERKLVKWVEKITNICYNVI
nr:MAG TPA: hypothetical protein [Caudoviricetes sp.]